MFTGSSTLAVQFILLSISSSITPAIKIVIVCTFQHDVFFSPLNPISLLSQPSKAIHRDCQVYVQLVAVRQRIDLSALVHRLFHLTRKFAAKRKRMSGIREQDLRYNLLERSNASAPQPGVGSPALSWEGEAYLYFVGR